MEHHTETRLCWRRAADVRPSLERIRRFWKNAVPLVITQEDTHGFIADTGLRFRKSSAGFRTPGRRW
jgi:hypothetical protein